MVEIHISDLNAKPPYGQHNRNHNKHKHNGGWVGINNNNPAAQPNKSGTMQRGHHKQGMAKPFPIPSFSFPQKTKNGAKCPRHKKTNKNACITQAYPHLTGGRREQHLFPRKKMIFTVKIISAMKHWFVSDFPILVCQFYTRIRCQYQRQHHH